MSNNTTQKILIETLTTTHTNASTAYILAKNSLKTPAEREQINKIAKKFNIEV